ncbi:MAG: sigma-70 family RNA polymerase sigma factor [Acidobacteriaceae bacterium]|nr:sigma-70 family RNA polymerase sigma factor [Acidobacteriaceae bacterium]
MSFITLSLAAPTQGKPEIAAKVTDLATAPRGANVATPLLAHTDASDEHLLRMAQHGQADAFTQLVQRHFPVCLKRAFTMLRNRSDAEDEVQNAFAKAFQSLETFRFEGTFSAWLYRIVQNQCLMRLREQRQVGFVSIDQITEANARLELIDQVSSPEEELGAEQVDTLLQREISRVPPLMRNVILLRDVQGLPMPEVATRLGISIPAAKSRLMRARKEMRARLLKHCGRRGQRTLTFRVNHHPAEYTYLS